MPMLTIDQIKIAVDRQIEKVEVPEWGGDIYMRELDGKGRDDFEKDVSTRGGAENFDIRGLRTKLLSLVICDEAGQLLFKEEDVDILESKSASVIARLFEKAQKMNNIGEAALEDAEKNSDEGQRD